MKAGWYKRVRIGVPHIAIALVMVILALDYRTYRNVGRWKWPVEGWQMYAGKTNLDPVVSYRRFLAHHDDGRVTQTGLGDPLAFLLKPYRVDFGLSRDLPRFLITCLREMRTTSAGAHLVGLTYETRTWWYRKRSLADHLAHEPPSSSYRVMAIDLPPAAPGPGAANLLLNGDFVDCRADTGAPKIWELDGKPWNGLGADPASDRRCLLLPGAPDGSARTASQKVAVPAAAAGGATLVKASAWARSGGPDVFIELELAAGGQPVSARSQAIPADGAWHRVEVAQPVAAGVALGAATVILHSVADGFFADVRLVTDAAPGQ
jgi:hypothetical protein